MSHHYRPDPNYKGGKRVAPGFYQAPDGSIHVHCGEILQHLGIELTEENQDFVIEAVREHCRAYGLPYYETVEED